MSESRLESKHYARSARATVRAVVLVVGGCFLLLAGLLRYQTYRTTVAQAERLTLDYLGSVALAAAHRIDGDAHARLTRRYDTRDAITSVHQDSDYAAIHAVLAESYADFGLTTPIYTYVRDRDGAVEFVATSSAEPYYRHAFTTVQSGQAARYGRRGTLPVYEDEAGTWLSGYAPLTDASGAVVGMVQADERFDVFIAKARAAALEGSGWNLVLLGALLGLVYVFADRLMRREQAAKEALAEAADAQRLLAEDLAAREADLARSARLLERSNRDLADFANIASHDLKSPLRGIASFAQLLARRSRADLDEGGREYLAFILDNSKRALALVDGLLAYAKADDATGNASTFPACHAAKDAVANLDAAIRERGGLVFVREMHGVTADRVLVTQVFQNLIGNGIKYNRSERPEVYVDAVTTGDGERAFRVRDNGIGISPEHRERVFEMFSRLNAGDEFEGSGIGLAFCARIVAAYGGRLWLESDQTADGEPGRADGGSTFYFTLPGAQAPSLPGDAVERALAVG